MILMLCILAEKAEGCHNKDIPRSVYSRFVPVFAIRSLSIVCLPLSQYLQSSSKKVEV